MEQAIDVQGAQARLFGKIAKTAFELKAPKNKNNSFGKYDYRTAEGILEALKPLLMANGLWLVIDDEIVQRDERYYVVCTLTIIDTETGAQFVTRSAAREERSRSGMCEGQVTGATISYARKYALGGAFAIDASEGDLDTMDNRERAHIDKKQQAMLWSVTGTDEFGQGVMLEALKRHGIKTPGELYVDEFEDFGKALRKAVAETGVKEDQ